MSKPRVILFGASKAGSSTYAQIKTEVNVIAFCDNDINKHHKKFCNKLIISPDEISHYNVDGVIITSMYTNEIYKQLKDLNFPEQKIFTQWTQSNSTRPIFPWDAVIFIVIIISLLLFIIFY